MTVAELIRRLQRCKPDAYVLFFADNEEEYDVDCVSEVKYVGSEKDGDTIRVELR